MTAVLSLTKAEGLKRHNILGGIMDLEFRYRNSKKIGKVKMKERLEAKFNNLKEDHNEKFN